MVLLDILENNINFMTKTHLYTTGNKNHSLEGNSITDVHSKQEAAKILIHV